MIIETTNWAYGVRHVFRSYGDMRKYFEGNFDTWKKKGIGTKVIGLTLYVFDGYYKEEDNGRR